MVSVEMSSDDPAQSSEHRVAEMVVAFAAGELLPDGGRGCSVSLRLADDDEISRLHDAFFGNPEPTDVMSFPSGEAAHLPGASLGDVAISISVARSQAVEHSHSVTREIAFLALHGFLHLLGLDDADDDSRAHMLDTQARLLEEFEREHGAI